MRETHKWAAIALGMLFQAGDYDPNLTMSVLHTGQKAQEEQWMSNTHNCSCFFLFIYIYIIYNRKANSEIVALLSE